MMREIIIIFFITPTTQIMQIDNEYDKDIEHSSKSNLGTGNLENSMGFTTHFT